MKSFYIYLLLFLLIFCFIAYYLNRNFQGARELMDSDFVPYYSRILGDKTETYFERDSMEKLSLKSGQLKLLLNELEFYTMIADEYFLFEEKIIVIYAGAAEGYHEKALTPLFPNWLFILYDPRPFFEELKEIKNIELHQEFFTNNSAKALYKKYKKNKILFLSDIRTENVELAVHENMLAQMEWCKILKPFKAMLKFRLPWENIGENDKFKTVDYFDGIIYTQPFIGPTSTEMRLITDCKKIITYDCKNYESRVFYFQRYQRNAFYEIDSFDAFAAEIIGLDHCYDCWSMLEIVKNFFAKIRKIQDKKELMSETAKYINSAMEVCRKKLDVPPHGEYPDEKNIWLKMQKLKDISENYEIHLDEKRLKYSQKK